MNKIANLLAAGEIQPADLVGANELIERANLVHAAMEQLSKKILFPLGTQSVTCYDYTDRAGEYSAWGNCNIYGDFTCCSNWGGDHVIGRCNLLSFDSIFNAFDKPEFSNDLERFLKSMLENKKD